MREVRFESLRGGFPLRWEYVGFYPIDASIRGWQELPSAYVLWNRKLIIIRGWERLPSRYNELADMFTKALSEDRFKYLVRRLGMRCLTPEELEVLANESA
ncbi:hypothetical protein Tco_1297870 [Tanacetum coccineum]